MKILISAFSCSPGRGSEPGIGWNVARQMADIHDVWVLTRMNNREAIETQSCVSCPSSLHFIYFDLPFMGSWVGGIFSAQVYYYLWHLASWILAWRYDRRIRFDLVHHLTWGRYWMPNLLCLLPAPFLWGPVAGGESVPTRFWKDFGFRGQVYEFVRIFFRWLGEHDPFVYLTAKNTVLALTPTDASAHKLNRINVRGIELFAGQTGINQEEFARLSRMRLPDASPIRFISIGRLLHWKGVHLSLRALAATELRNAIFWVVGDGPERHRLECLSRTLNISQRVVFWGNLSRLDTWSLLEKCHVLLHPCLHDLTTTACIEAMAAGRPVITVDLGGGRYRPSRGDATLSISACSPEEAVQKMASKMSLLATQGEIREHMGYAARQEVMGEYTWERKVQRLNGIYMNITGIHKRE